MSTLVLCSVADPAAALREVGRVLRPGGTLVFIEHVRGEGRKARWQDRVTPVWKIFGAGCHPNRATVAAIEAADFEITEVESFEPHPSPPIIRPFVQGVARRQASRMQEHTV